ncbi:galactose-specific lectin nattectin-like isoform X2 [Engraulis encrasicolus]|uniref:galactose-specific lectin nattectin-like isoform X2 n=1 Tax=Engraulis encrasicolus TaxID=184585 RepID=UPI002FD6B8F5
MKLTISMATLSTLGLLYAVFAPSVTAGPRPGTTENRKRQPAPPAQPVKYAAQCRSGWTPGGGGRCFKFFSEQLTWSEAEEQCVRYGGHLASIHNEYEQNTVNKISTSDIKSWIGGVGNQKPGNTYSWTDGTTIDFKRWADYEPNNSGNNEHCMDNDHSKGGKWNDDTCHKKLPYVCAV